MQLKLGNIEFSLPEKWDDMPAQLIVGVSPFLFQETEKNKIEILKLILPADILPYFFLLDATQLYDLMGVIDWMYESFFPKLYIEGVTADDGEIYLPPEPLMKRSTIIEFAYADKYFEMIANGDSSKINQLLLTLCRPQRKPIIDREEWNGDKREKFNPVLIEERIAKITQVPLAVKMHLLIFFIQVKKQIAQRYAVIFSNRDEDEKKPSGNDFGWVGVIWDLAGGIADEEKIQYTNMHNVMGYLSRQKTQANQEKNGIPK